MLPFLVVEVCLWAVRLYVCVKATSEILRINFFCLILLLFYLFQTFLDLHTKKLMPLGIGLPVNLWDQQKSCIGKRGDQKEQNNIPTYRYTYKEYISGAKQTYIDMTRCA